ncbi:MAG: low molecular weight phosphotyrosine protein phosphatase [Clostridia bacterium]|nr:low molecular weight phosphotyrosine protein phosphatase [Clostridia bacterium]
MITVSFVCLGNICRSPMAELICKHEVEKRNLALSFDIKSFATSEYEVGNPIYTPAKRTLEKHGIEGTHIARQITKKDVINSDYILVMDTNNLFDVLRLTSGEFGEKIFKLCSFTSNPRDVADPWYTGDFERAFNDIYDGVNCFLDSLLKEKKEAFDYDKRH